MQNLRLRAFLTALVCVLVVSSARAETVMEAQRRHVHALNQKLVELKARHKEDAPELVEAEAILQAQTKYCDELRVRTQEHLEKQLEEFEKRLELFRTAKIKADPAHEILFEQGRVTVLRRLMEHQLGFELDKDLVALPEKPADAAAAEAIRTGAVTFRIPDSTTPAGVDGILRQVAAIAPSVKLNYLIHLRILTASGGDSVQLRRVQGLADAIKLVPNTPMPMNEVPVQPPAAAARPPRPPAPNKEEQNQF